LRDLFATWRKKSQLWPLAWHKRGEICLMSQRQPRMNTVWRLGIADALATGGRVAMRKHELQGSGSLTIRAPSTSRHTLLSTSALAGGAMRGFVMATGLAASASLFVTRRFRQTS
jgi:hypothetical protein